MGTQGDFGNFRSGYEALSELWKVQTLALVVQEGTESSGGRRIQELPDTFKVSKGAPMG